MSDGSSLFNSAIEEHLLLKRRNAQLESDLPLDEFIGDDPFVNHPLFKTEEDARREDEETGEHPAIPLPTLSETQELPVVEEPETGSPRGWMETTSSQDFTWD
jgi:hypothetical protein